MNIVNWEPLRELDDLFNHYSRLARQSASRSETDAWTPSADIIETEKEYLIKARLPVVSREDAKVTVAQGALTITGERRREKEQRGENEIRVESFYGTFSRSFSLPENVDTHNVHAESKDGVLKIHVPNTEAAKPKTIRIEVK